MPQIAVLLLFLLCAISSAQSDSSSNSIEIVRDTLIIQNREDHLWAERMIKESAGRRDTLLLIRQINPDLNEKYRYQIEKNGILKWWETNSNAIEDIETLFIQNVHSTEIEKQKIEKLKTIRGYYKSTPWKDVPPVYREEGLPSKMVDWFAWKSGAAFSFNRIHLYNFTQTPEDTTEVFVDMGKPALYDYRMDLSYTHRFNFIWVGAGIERSYQQCNYWDTVQVDRLGWWSRMGWNINISLPGIQYKLFRDAGVIPFYAQYEDSIYVKMHPDADYSYTNPLPLIEDTTFRTEPNEFFPNRMDTLWIPYRLKKHWGLGHEITAKIGYFQYDITIHPVAYKAPIQKLGLREMPFFHGDWDIGLLILPNGTVIPQFSIDGYRTDFKLGAGSVAISPFNLSMEVWGRGRFFASFGVNGEYRLGKATMKGKR